MNKKDCSTANPFFFSKLMGSLNRHQLLGGICLALAAASTSHAQNLTWAPNGTGPSDGSGTWLAGNNWWNGTSIVSGNWTGTTPNGATLGDGTAGTYAVDLGGNSVSLTNLLFNTSGYTVQDGTLAFYAPAGQTTGNYNMINVGAGVSAGISAFFTNNYTVGNSVLTVGSGGVLTLTGGGGLDGNTVTTGAGTVDFNTGTYSGNNFVLWTEANTTVEAATLNVGRLLIGYSGNSTLTINSASAQITGSGSGGNNAVGRSGDAGEINLIDGTVNLSASGNTMRLAYDANSKGTLSVEDGIFNLGSTANEIYVNYDGTGATGAGTFDVSGGTVTTEGIILGGGASAGTYTSGSTATVNITGGITYVGSGGINVNSANVGTLTTSISLSGGIIGAAAAWTSTANAVLGTTGGNITFQTTDANGVAHNITWNGVLSGAGGLNETGLGILTLGGVNTYTGNTTINGSAIISDTGHLSFEIGANGINNQINGIGSITLDGAFDINTSGAGTAAGDEWDLVNTANGLSASYGTGFTVDGYTQDPQNSALWVDGIYTYDAADGILSVQSVPEPSTASAMIFGGIGMFMVLRRRMNRK